MAATKIEIKLFSITVLNDAVLFGPGSWIFEAQVCRCPSNDKISFGDPGRTFEVNTGDILVPGLSHQLKIEPADAKIEIEVHGIDKDGILNDDLGSVKVTVNMPIVHDYDLRLKSNKGNFSARIKIDILEQTEATKGPVTTILQRRESNTYNTVHDEMLTRMVHVCPVVPVPWANGIPPLAKGVQALPASPQVDLSVSAATTRLNGLVNPSLIPVISPASPRFANECARIRITQYRPFGPGGLDLNKIIWRAASPNIKFWAGGSGKSEVKGGQEVNAYGVLAGDKDEEGKIEVRWDSEGTPLLAVFRAWVGPPKYVWMRANIIKCSSATDPGGTPVLNPTCTPDDIKKHVAFSNILLWQMGIRLAMDTDKTAYNGATRKEEGIFEVTSADNYTFNVVKDDKMVAPMLNSRGDVFNLVYLHSCAGSPTLLGRATDRCLSEPEAEVQLPFGGNPSDSWVRPTGVFPDDDAKAIKMKRMGPSNLRADAQKPLCGDSAIAKLCACLITQLDDVANGSVTMAHELGHVIGLMHRGSGGNEVKGSTDGVNHLAGPRKGFGHPWNENCMTYGTDSEAQDFDMTQTMVARSHKLVRSLRPAPPVPVPPPPKGPKPVPAAWLPTAEDKVLLQSYLSGKTPGLKHTGYDLGTSGPKGDGVDGIIGPKTKAALRSFQKDHGGLTADGIYGPKTRAAFDAEINGP